MSKSSNEFLNLQDIFARIEGVNKSGNTKDGYKYKNDDIDANSVSDCFAGLINQLKCYQEHRSQVSKLYLGNIENYLTALSYMRDYPLQAKIGQILLEENDFGTKKEEGQTLEAELGAKKLEDEEVKAELDAKFKQFYLDNQDTIVECGIKIIKYLHTTKEDTEKMYTKEIIKKAGIEEKFIRESEKVVIEETKQNVLFGREESDNIRVIHSWYKEKDITRVTFNSIVEIPTLVYEGSNKYGIAYPYPEKSVVDALSSWLGQDSSTDRPESDTSLKSLIGEIEALDIS